MHFTILLPRLKAAHHYLDLLGGIKVTGLKPSVVKTLNIRCTLFPPTHNINVPILPFPSIGNNWFVEFCSCSLRFFFSTLLLSPRTSLYSLNPDRICSLKSVLLCLWTRTQMHMMMWMMLSVVNRFLNHKKHKTLGVGMIIHTTISTALSWFNDQLLEKALRRREGQTTCIHRICRGTGRMAN